MSKFLAGLFVLIVVVVMAVGFLMSGTLAENKIQNALERMTGFQVEVQGAQITDFGKKIFVEQIVILNPSGFTEKVFAKIGDIEMLPSSRKALLSGRLELESLRFHIRSLHGERQASGRVNFREMACLQKEVLESLQNPSENSNFLAKRVEIHMEDVLFREVLADGKQQDTPIALTGQKDVYGNVRSSEILIFGPLLRVLGGLGRGTLGIPRIEIQKSILSNTGTIKKPVLK